MGSEYEPLFGARHGVEDDLTPVREIFERAARPFVRSPWSWLCWALVLPAVALATPSVLQRYDFRGALFAWSGAVLVGGVVEMWTLHKAGVPQRSPLARWVLRNQANLSLIGVVLSVVLVTQGGSEFLPGLWLLVLGYSFSVMGGLSFAAFRRAGLIYQLGGIGALMPGQSGLVWFAVAVFLGNSWIAASVWRSSRATPRDQ